MADDRSTVQFSLQQHRHLTPVLTRYCLFLTKLIANKIQHFLHGKSLLAHQPSPVMCCHFYQVTVVPRFLGRLETRSAVILECLLYNATPYLKTQLPCTRQRDGSRFGGSTCVLCSAGWVGIPISLAQTVLTTGYETFLQVSWKVEVLRVPQGLVFPLANSHLT